MMHTINNNHYQEFGQNSHYNSLLNAISFQLQQQNQQLRQQQGIFGFDLLILVACYTVTV
ncbi:hypothetical protein BD408DRAFT_421498 [Parasitella parasitica]|nr:hypothetical protein BD408DRAFT_421498 [Parasitella parasitica]